MVHTPPPVKEGRGKAPSFTETPDTLFYQPPHDPRKSERKEWARWPAHWQWAGLTALRRPSTAALPTLTASPVAVATAHAPPSPPAATEPSGASSPPA